MARTVSEIYNVIVAEKESQPNLAGLKPDVDDAQTLLEDLSSPSKVAVWRLMVYIISVAMWVHEMLWDLFKADVTKLIEPAQYGTLPWYQRWSLLFQYGDALEWIANKYQYAVIDADKQIIKRAAAVENGNIVTIKVAKLSAEEPVKLEADELTAFSSYIKQIKPAGVKVAIISYDADELKLTLRVYYDPMVLNSSGVSILNADQPVNIAIKNYLANIVWGGQLNVTKLTDAIQAAEGVRDIVLVMAQAKSAIDSGWTSIIPASNPNYVSISGYFQKEPQLIITYIPYIPYV